MQIRYGEGGPRIERVEVSFKAEEYSPHRHDTYAIGVTLSGIQAFKYRGVQRCCMPGECHVLHPDELRDGLAGAEDGFSYRIAYIDPSLIQSAVGGTPLPFVKDPIVKLRGPHKRQLETAWDMTDKIDDLRRSRS